MYVRTTPIRSDDAPMTLALNVEALFRGKLDRGYYLG